jgi:hypothetical protein
MRNFRDAQKRAKQRKMREISDSQRKTAQNRLNLDAQKQRKTERKNAQCTSLLMAISPLFGGKRDFLEIETLFT